LQVKKYGPTQKCGSVNNCGDTMATNNWVAERVVDCLKDNPKKRIKGVTSYIEEEVFNGDSI